MMIFLLTIKPEFDLFDVWELMKSLTIEPLYSSVNIQGLEELYVRIEKKLDQDLLYELKKYTVSFKEASLPPIDWNDQWEKHAPGYTEGFVHLNLNSVGAKKSLWIQLKPGPGFGDLSHSTTSMVLKLLCAEEEKHISFLDIGTGSGVLAISASLLGYSHVYGLDIDKDALNHAKQNVQLNQLESFITLFFPEELDILLKEDFPRVAAMNMIVTEQMQAWFSLKKYHSFIQTLFISGVLLKERDSYLEQAALWGFRVVKELIENEWIAFKFIRIM